MRKHGLTIGQLRQLLAFPEYRQEVEPFLRTRMLLRLKGTGPETRVVDGQGHLISIEDLYTMVLDDNDLDRAFYQLAMTCWR